jgi:hypothetical protein
MGWAYYTREWADAWAPIYSDAWGSLNGAVGMLYEQAGIGGAPLERASGRVVSYRAAVHGQALASLTNLETLRANRAEILRDYLAARRKNCSESRPGGERAFVLVPGSDSSREALFLKTLIAQGIEVWRTRGELRAHDATDGLDTRDEAHTFPAGTYVVPLAQPQGSLVDAFLGFDPRMGDEFLLEERKKLEKESISKIYDVTAWDLGHAYGLDAWWCTPEETERDLVPVSDPESRLSAPGEIVPSPRGAAWAWIVDGSDDSSLRFAAHALELGLAVHLADEPFTVGDWPERTFARGSILVRRQENEDGIDELVERATRSSRAEVLAISSGRAPAEGPDLGGGHFHLLAHPRIALLANAPIEREGFGHIWHYLDTDLAVPVTLLDVQDMEAHDLRRYNVLLIPPGDGLVGLLEPLVDELRAWISGGGTLIACGSSAAELVDRPQSRAAARARGRPRRARALERVRQTRDLSGVGRDRRRPPVGRQGRPPADATEAPAGASKQSGEEKAALRRIAELGAPLRAIRDLLARERRPGGMARIRRAANDARLLLRARRLVRPGPGPHSCSTRFRVRPAPLGSVVARGSRTSGGFGVALAGSDRSWSDHPLRLTSGLSRLPAGSAPSSRQRDPLWTGDGSEPAAGAVIRVLESRPRETNEQYERETERCPLEH